MLKKCCCMFDLESGSMIIGLMDLVFGIISILKTSITHSWNPGNEGLEILVAIAVLVASILLIIGVQKKNVRCIVIWIALKVVALTMASILLVLTLAVSNFTGKNEFKFDVEVFVYVLVCISFIVFQFYLVLVVDNYRQQLMSSSINNQPAIASPAAASSDYTAKPPPYEV